MVDPEIVAERLRYINEYTNDLKRMRGLSKEEYIADIVTQRAVERTFMNLIQSCIDLAGHIRASEDLPADGTSKRDVEALEDADIVSEDVREKLVEAVGFRNVLAHRYGDVNHDIVYEVLHEDLQWFDRFQQEVARWLRERE